MKKMTVHTMLAIAIVFLSTTAMADISIFGHGIGGNSATHQNRAAHAPAPIAHNAARANTAHAPAPIAHNAARANTARVNAAHAATARANAATAQRVAIARANAARARIAAAQARTRRHH